MVPKYFFFFLNIFLTVCICRIYLGGEIEEKDLNFLVDIWEVANCFKFKELHRIVQKKIISIFQGKQLLLEQSPSFFYDLRNMFERAYFHKARHINRFCSSYLLDHLDKFLKDSHCFPKGNINNLHEKYVEWLFKALQDNYEDSKQFQDLAQPENVNKSKFSHFQLILKFFF